MVHVQRTMSHSHSSASGADWRFERAKMAAANGGSVTHTIFGFYDRPCELSKEVTDLIDGMLAIGPESRLTVAQVLASHYAQGTRLPAGEQYGAQAVYRGSAAAFNDPNALRALLAEESDEPMRPVYRGGPAAGPPPLLGKQHAFNRDEDAEMP